VRIVALLFAAAVFVWAAGDPVAARLAHEARKAQDAGQVVRAYLLFAEAAARDPHTVSYAVRRDSMKSLADLMTRANIANVDISADVKQAEADAARNTPEDNEKWQGLPDISREDLRAAAALQPPPQIQVSAAVHDFDLRADDKSVISQVARAWGIEAVFDPSFETRPNIRLSLTVVDFRTAMDALTAATGTFVFAISPHQIFVARDSEIKRNEFEPEIALSVHLPNAVDPKDIVEAANAVRAAVAARGVIAWDSAGNQVIIRDHVTRAQAARSLLEALLLPRAQVSFQVQLMTVDSDVMYQYGVSWQTSYQFLPLGLLSRYKNLNVASAVTGVFLPFGGGATLFGIGLADASLLASYSQSHSRIFYDATVVVGDGQSATLHVGDKYPIPTSLYSGASQSSGAAAYNPIGQVTQEDLGLTLKILPHVHGDGDIALSLEATFETLGTIVLNSVPSVNERGFKGDLTVEEGEWAIVAGMEQDSRTVSKNGFPGLSELAGLSALFTQTTRDHSTSDTLVVIKPTITRLPMSAEISPQFLLGPQRGARVLL
jgi:general secretion pathway protein D